MPICGRSHSAHAPESNVVLFLCYDYREAICVCVCTRTRMCVYVCVYFFNFVCAVAVDAGTQACVEAAC